MDDESRSFQRPTINIILGDRERLPEKRPRLFPKALVVVAKIALAGVVLAGLYYGPAYYTCRQLKERGMFYYGTTLSACVRERLEARANPFEDMARRLLPVL